MEENFFKSKQFPFKDISFASLMTKRIYNVLLIASKYDLFILEEDGRIDEQIYDEYTSLNLTYPPRFTRASSEEEAMSLLKENHYELVIFMPNLDDIDMFATARHIKEKYENIPMVVLTAFSKAVSKRLNQSDLSFVDYVFSWLGNTDLLLAIIKLIEDSMNIEQDVETVGVQSILIVENSIRFYSSVLPSLFKIIMRESQEFSKEALNTHQQMLRMRARPKIMLARNYEEARSVYSKYKDNILGVITDMSYKKEGKREKLAGYYLTKWIHEQDHFLPVIINSSEEENSHYAQELHCKFIDKNSKNYTYELKKQVVNEFRFGDFVIINPNTREELYRIKNLKGLQQIIKKIPDDSLYYHMSHNHFSRFLYSIAIFPIAKLLKEIKLEDLKLEEARQLIYNSIVEYRRMKNAGIIAVFDKNRFDEFSNFARIGEGSLGGKGRGLAFLGNIIKTRPELNRYANFPVIIPKTVVLCTDIFDEFMESNNLYEIVTAELSDEETLNHFLQAKLPTYLDEDFLTFFQAINSPLAVRSSSLLEDSYYQPFAGIYSTYMVPSFKDKTYMLQCVKNAVKAVYASVFYKESKAYMSSTHNIMDEEKMGIVLQEMVGQPYGNRFYPNLSGVAKSLNFYPIDYEKAEEGIVNLALGLGKYIVEGGLTLRFSPYYPHNILQLSTVDLALKETQRIFYALNIENMSETFQVNDDFNLLKLTVNEAVPDGSLRYIASTYEPNDQIIYEGVLEGGRKIISCAGLLESNRFPLAETLKKILSVAKQEMGREIEIEFAINILNKEKAVFYLLQIRPIVSSKEVVNEDLQEIENKDCILYSSNALGNGIIDDVYDIIYVKTKAFEAKNNVAIAEEIQKINQQFTEDNGYILVGPGRWGSSDSWLGIPVKWSYITHAKLLVELGLKNYNIEPSQGTHFFQNLTSFGMGYFTVNPFQTDKEIFDEDFLNNQIAVYESDFIRHIRFKKPIIIKINGKKKQGLVLKS